MKVQKTIGKIVAVFFLMAMLFCIAGFAMPQTAKAEGTSTINVEEKRTTPGKDISVEIQLSNSPNVAVLFFDLKYDDSVLTLNSITYGEEFSTGGEQPQTYHSPVRISWSDLTEKSGTMTFAVLHFSVTNSINAEYNAKIEIVETSLDAINIDEQEVEYTIVNGGITIMMGVPGDITGDGKVNAMDLLRLRKHFAGWEVEVDEIALDVTGDGKVNAMDLLRLRKYFAGWEVEIFYGTTSNLKCAHLMEKTEAKEATCLEDGSIEYWYCSRCKKYFSDVNGNTEISLEDTILTDGSHIYATEWSFDETHHWHEMNCGHEEEENVVSVIDLSEHSYDTITHRCICGYQEFVTISFVDYNGQILSSVKKEFGTNIIFADEIQNPERGGYLFAGWINDGSKADSMTATQSVILRASYNRAHTVVFVSDNKIFDTQLVVEGGNALPPENNPQKDGYIFEGWENYNNIITDRVVHAIYVPIQYTITYVMPDGTAIGQPQTIDYGSVATVPEVDSYWFNWDNYHMYMFTNWIFDGGYNWSFSDIETEVISQYKADASRMPSITIIANYATEYNLPVIVIEEETGRDSIEKIQITIVIPSNSTCYLYAIDLKFSYGINNSLNLSVVNESINTGTVLYGDGETTISKYNNKTKTFEISWQAGISSGKTFTERQMIDTLEIECPYEGFIIGDNNFVLVNTSSLIVATSEDADYNDLQKITPIVVYRKK